MFDDWRSIGHRRGLWFAGRIQDDARHRNRLNLCMIYYILVLNCCCAFLSGVHTKKHLVESAQKPHFSANGVSDLLHIFNVADMMKQFAAK